MNVMKREFKILSRFPVDDKVNGISIGNGIFGIWNDGSKINVTHIPSGYRIGKDFKYLGDAYQFAEELARLSQNYDLKSVSNVKSMGKKISEIREGIDGKTVGKY